MVMLHLLLIHRQTIINFVAAIRPSPLQNLTCTKFDRNKKKVDFQINQNNEGKKMQFQRFLSTDPVLEI